MVPFWCAFGPVLRRLILKCDSVRSVGKLLLLLCLPPWLSYFIPASFGGDPNWYRVHHTGVTTHPLDLLVVTLKFNPLCYFHVFVFGMGLARLRNLLELGPARAHGPAHDGRPSCAARVAYRLGLIATSYGTLLGYCGLLLLFTVRELRPTSYKLSARLSLLMPLQGMILLGLTPLDRHIDRPASASAAEAGETGPAAADGTASRRPRRPTDLTTDPLALAFSLAPGWWGNLSYCQYVLQFIAMQATLRSSPMR